MRTWVLGFVFVCAGWLLTGCASCCISPVKPAARYQVKVLPAELKAKILALNPERVTDREVKEVLSQAPAPHVLSIHGGLFPIKTGMNSFSRFLIGMGYPEASLRHPGNGSYAYGYYNRSDALAGTVAWYYEQDGLRPILVGHSQGGMQVVRVLHKLAGGYGPKLALYNPSTRNKGTRYEITDPLTGQTRPIVGLQVSYATAAVAGGLARLLPNEWDVNSRLRKIPDSVEEFTGFQKGFDLLGGDFLGYGSANDYHATGNATVRNVRLPAASPHSTIPYAERLLKDGAARNWLQDYQPREDTEGGGAATPEPPHKSARLLWAAEVWYSIKKHWVLELQHLVRAQEAADHERREN